MKKGNPEVFLLLLVFLFFIYLEEKDLIEPKQFHTPEASTSPSQSLFVSPVMVGTASVGSASLSPSASLSASASPSEEA